jgi:hypothetical protein
MYNNNKQLYIQTPKCLTKQGLVKNGKKIFTDLMFDNNEESFIHWLENLENKCQDLIFDKGETWFENKLEKNDIESAFVSPIRVYKSGKYYLLRVNIKVNNTTNIPAIKIYNENELPQTIDDINSETNIISIIEIQGIKFTSRNFQIEIELKQTMVLNTDVVFENCLIKTNANSNINGKINNENTKNNEKLINNKCLNNESFTNKNGDILEKLSEIIINENYDLTMKDNINDLGDSTPINTDEINDLGDSTLINTDEINDITNENEYMVNNNIESESENKNESEISVHKINEEIPNCNFVDDIETATNNYKLDGLQEIDIKLEDINEKEQIDNFNELREIDLNVNIDTLESESLKLKKPNEVYYEIYKQTRKKAKQAKKDAILAFLEAKNIKKTYMLDDINESDSDDSDLENNEESLDNF